MGIKKDGYAKIWKIDRKDNFTKVQLSTSKKSKDGLKYETDFSGFVSLIGHAHNKAADLKEGDRIKIGDFEVTNSYNKETKVGYTNIAVFEYEIPGATIPQNAPPVSSHAPVDKEEDPNDLPF